MCCSWSHQPPVGTLRPEGPARGPRNRGHVVRCSTDWQGWYQVKDEVVGVYPPSKIWPKIQSSTLVQLAGKEKGCSPQDQHKDEPPPQEHEGSPRPTRYREHYWMPKRPKSSPGWEQWKALEQRSCWQPRRMKEPEKKAQPKLQDEMQPQWAQQPDCWEDQLVAPKVQYPHSFKYPRNLTGDEGEEVEVKGRRKGELGASLHQSQRMKMAKRANPERNPRRNAKPMAGQVTLPQWRGQDKPNHPVDAPTRRNSKSSIPQETRKPIRSWEFERAAQSSLGTSGQAYCKTAIP